VEVLDKGMSVVTEGVSVVTEGVSVLRGGVFVYVVTDEVSATTPLSSSNEMDKLTVYLVYRKKSKVDGTSNKMVGMVVV
jgi:hypothetical protein